jgi:hypothetical protein
MYSVSGVRCRNSVGVDGRSKTIDPKTVSHLAPRKDTMNFLVVSTFVVAGLGLIWFLRARMAH